MVLDLTEKFSDTAKFSHSAERFSLDHCKMVALQVKYNDVLKNIAALLGQKSLFPPLKSSGNSINMFQYFI